MASIKPKEAFVVTDLHGYYYVIDNRNTKTYVVCESDFEDWALEICALLNKSIGYYKLGKLPEGALDGLKKIKAKPKSFKDRIKGALVHFYRAARDGDYLEELNKAVEEISDEERGYWDEYAEKNISSEGVVEIQELTEFNLSKIAVCRCHGSGTNCFSGACDRCGMHKSNTIK